MALTGWSISNYLSVGAALVTAAPCTIAAFIKQADTGTTRTVVQSGTSGTGNHRFALLVSSAQRNQALVQTTSGDQAVAGVSNGTNVWVHAAAVFVSATDRKAYLNGANEGSNATSLTPTPAGMNMTRIGVNTNTLQPFSGAIQRVTIFNRALSAAEIQQLAGGMYPTLLSDCIAWYELDSATVFSNLATGLNAMTLTGTLVLEPPPLVLGAGLGTIRRRRR